MTHEEALAMTNYYQNKPATLHGRDVKIYLSKELMVIEVRTQSELAKWKMYLYFIRLFLKYNNWAQSLFLVAVGIWDRLIIGMADHQSQYSAFFQFFWNSGIFIIIF